MHIYQARRELRIIDLNDRSIVLCQNVRIHDDCSLRSRQLDLARGDLYAIVGDLGFIRVQLAWLPSRAYVGRAVRRRPRAYRRWSARSRYS
jgi:hypothetical protein